MKKIVFVTFVSCFLLSCGSLYVYANAGESLSDWHEFIFQSPSKEQVAMRVDWISEKEETVTQQVEMMLQESEREIDVFLSTSIANSSQDIENYQKDYLSRLTETKDVLGDSYFKDYTENKKEEINVEITQDVNEYVTELLGE